MTFNQPKFEKHARMTTPTKIAERLGITRQAVAQRLQNLENIRLREFLIICELIDEKPETFYSTGETHGKN